MNFISIIHLTIFRRLNLSYVIPNRSESVIFPRLYFMVLLVYSFPVRFVTGKEKQDETDFRCKVQAYICIYSLHLAPKLKY